MKKLFCVALSAFIGGCVSLPACDKAEISEDVLVETAKGFLRDVLSYKSDTLLYEVKKMNCGYVVSAFDRPNEFDSDTSVFINTGGVYMASSPLRVIFDIRGDYWENIPCARPYPLVRRNN